jgi:hypothetical protein
MNCKSCNTRIPPNGKSCPACGRSMKAVSFSTGPKKKSEKAVLLESSVKVPSAEGRPRTEPAVPKSKRVNPEKTVVQKLSPPPKIAAEAPPSLFSVDPSELRALLVEQPELLDPGLCVLCGDAGQVVGANYATEVGGIDLLAVDGEGDYVVVTVADRDPNKDLIGGVLQRVGWVRKHLGKEGRQVRAIVLTEPLPDDLQYAAAAVVGTIEFKTYRVALSFDDLAV